MSSRTCGGLRNFMGLSLPVQEAGGVKTSANPVFGSQTIEIRGWGGGLAVALGADGHGVPYKSAEAAVREVEAVFEGGGGPALGFQLLGDGGFLLRRHREAQLQVRAAALLEIHGHGPGPDRMTREHPRAGDSGDGVREAGLV